MRARCLVALMLVLSTIPLAGQDTPARPFNHLWAGNLGFARTNQEGGGVNVTLSWGIGWRGLFDLTPVDITVIAGEGTGDSRYYWDASVDRCRDSQTGQFARTALCNTEPTYKYAGAAEVNFAPFTASASPFAGVGYRVGFGTDPYVTVGVISTLGAVAQWYGRFSLGPNFQQLLIGGQLRT
jgi:hypothetical protein